MGLGASRHRGLLGGGRGHPLRVPWGALVARSAATMPPCSAPVRYRVLIAGAAAQLPAAARCDARRQVGEPRAGHLPPATGRPRRAPLRRAETPHDGPGGRAHRRRAGDQRGRSPRHPGRRAAAQDLARRASQPGQRAARGDVADRPAARRCRRRSSSTPPASAAGWRSSRGSPAGHRSTAAPRCRGPSGSSWTCTTSSTARCRSTRGSWHALSAIVLGGSGLYKGSSGGWEGQR